MERISKPKIYTVRKSIMGLFLRVELVTSGRLW